MRTINSFIIRFLTAGSLLLSAGVVFFVSTVTGQDAPKDSKEECCWIDVKTGKRVRTAPASGINYGAMVANLDAGGKWVDPGVAVLSNDRERARNTKTGQNYARDNDDCWIDVKTGKRVPTVPASGINYGAMVENLNAGGKWVDPGVAVLDGDRERAHNTKTGQNFVREKCPPKDQASKTDENKNEATILVNLISEDTAQPFNTYGFNGSATHYFNTTFGVTGDFNANFKSEGTTDLRKISILGGVTFVPFEGVKRSDKVTISLHTLFGVSHFRSDNGTTSFTDNAFTMKLGGAVDVNVNRNFFIRPVQIDYAPTFFGGNTQHNFQIGAGAGFRF